MHLYNDDIYLRTMEPQDYPQIVDLCVYDGVFAQNEAEAREIGNKIEKDCAEGNSFHFAVCDREHERILGTIGFYRGLENSTGEVGYFLRPEFRRKGYGTKAIKTICEFGFSQLGLAQVIAYTGTDNVSSKKALESNGFRIESENAGVTKYFLRSRAVPTAGE